MAKLATQFFPVPWFFHSPLLPADRGGKQAKEQAADPARIILVSVRDQPLVIQCVVPRDDHFWKQALSG
jgi:hypothetical protein